MSHDNGGRIECRICGAKVHSIKIHLRDDHGGNPTIEEYERQYPDAPVLSELAKTKIAEQKAAATRIGMAGGAAATAKVAVIGAGGVEKKAFHETFGLGKVPAALNGRGEAIPITVLTGHAFAGLVPQVDPNHVFDIELLKNCLMAVELSIPLYGWGHKGAGKTTTLEQLCARTNRPMLRVQHTINTEESHIIGQWTVKGGETVFQPGPLALAMRHGWVYLADEYDYALPSVLSVYQPILEGKSLVIKEAQGTEWAIVHPHPNFRFMATGNTNGAGDETGLYQGTQIQNSANYDRFGVVVKVNYMPAELEEKVLQQQAKITAGDAKKLVDFANRIREAYDGNRMSDTVSPRTLIYAAKLGIRRGSYRIGLALAFINKLNKVDREVADGLAQRVFGS
jgi:cobaltochelatase CobS